MLSIVTTFAALWLAMRLAPATPIGRALHHWLIERPAARLVRITRGQVLLTLLLALAVGGVGWTMGHESARLIAMGLPELATWITMFEVTAYLDALAAIVTAASLTRIVGIKAWLRGIVPHRPAARARRRATRVRKPTAANDDADGVAAPALAA